MSDEVVTGMNGGTGSRRIGVYVCGCGGNISDYVSVDDVVRPHELGPGDGFGEIALVMQVPRTASVTARPQCDLLVLDAPVFIAAVTSSVVGSGIAARVVQEHLDSDATKAP